MSPWKRNNSEWGAPYSAQPKPKKNLVRFISDFRNLNKKLKHKSYPMPKINERLLKLEGFQYATPIDLRMGYYHIRLREKASNLCMIIPPWGKYCYKRLPMVVTNSPNIFRQKMNDLFNVFEFICVFIDDLWVLTKGD